MDHKIKNKNVIIIYVVVLLFLIFDFHKRKENILWQLNYKFKNESISFDFKNVFVSDIKDNSVTLSYKNNDKINVDVSTLKIEDSINHYYFKFDSYLKNNNGLVFKGGFWLVNTPSSVGVYKASLINLPITMREGINTALIADSQLLWRGGRNFQKELYEKNKIIRYVGEDEDIYGYPYTGGIMNSIESTLEKFDEVPKADLYIVLLGTHDSKLKILKTIDEYSILIKKIREYSQDSKILIINLPPSDINTIDEFNRSLNSGLNEIKKEVKNISIIDFYSLIKKNKLRPLEADKIHFKSEVYSLLLKKVDEEINKMEFNK